MSFTIVDGHEDLLWHFLQVNDNNRQTSPAQLGRSQVRLTFASIFTDDAVARQNCHYITRDIRAYQLMVDAYPQLALAKTFGDFDRILHSEKTGLMLHLEGLDCLGRDNWKEQLALWRMYGVLSAGIVWNENNRLGGGAHNSGGLTSLGRAVIRWMNRNKMIVDLAHTNPETFFNILDTVIKPPVVSHGNARAKADRRRNYTDEQLRALADRDGLIGVSFVPGFVRTDRLASLNDLADHIMYIIDLIGLQHVAIGSDFGGILSKKLIPRASHVGEIDLLFFTLERKGLRPLELDLVAHKNWDRVLRANLL